MNEMDAHQFNDLLKRYRDGLCTHDEKQAVEGWYNARASKPFNPLTANEEKQAGERMYRTIHRTLAFETMPTVVPLRRNYSRWLAAAGVLLLAGAAWYVIYNKQTIAPETAKVPATVQPVTAPVLPGGNKAVLTLADGSHIVLDSAANGALSQQGATLVMKQQDGELVYKNEGAAKEQAIAWNTISTPRGGQYQVVLPDGTKVWLNALTSLRFPAGFTGKERVVELTGEAYFEVAAAVVNGKKQPFIVDILPTEKGGRVEVLGTHFNIKAYNEDALIKTTLLEGAVKIDNGQRAIGNENSIILKPGQQAQLTNNGALTLNKNADVEEAVAWKNGRFQFNDASVQTVMREIARWYDVEIGYAGKAPTENFEGEIPRNSSIQEVFRILELSNVHCKIEGRRITVLP